MQPSLRLPHEMLQGLGDEVPAVYGQVITYPKPGASVLMETSRGPLLAAWQYGLGRSVAYTSDLSNRWGKDWVLWKHYGSFSAQMLKWAQRKETANRFSAAIQRDGERGTFTVDITTDQNRFVNHLALKANILFPSGLDQTASLDQISPGRYACDFAAKEIGAYYFSIFGHPKASGQKTYPGFPQVFGFGIPYTEEFNTTGVNEKLLEALAAVTGGRVLSAGTVPADLFTAKSETRGAGTPLWPYPVFMLLFFLVLEVAVRKLLNTGRS
jgi:hypothetical protein